MSQRLIDNWEVEIRRGAIQLLVCAVLNEEDLHGKGICDMISKETGDIIEVPLGTVYPLLRRYIGENLIETYKLPEDARKTMYKLNDTGIKFYHQMIVMWNRYSVAVNNVLA